MGGCFPHVLHDRRPRNPPLPPTRFNVGRHRYGARFRTSDTREKGSSVVFRRVWVVFGVAVIVLGVGAPVAEATWSIAAVDEETGEVGVAVASCVGFEVTVVPVLVPGVGVAASQADISGPSGERFVKAIAGGATAQEAVESVVEADEAPDDRQFGVVVIGDGGAGWTGLDTFDVALDRRGQNGAVSVQGNILVSEDVVSATISGFEAAEGDLADRLVAGLVAGADAGGDSRCGEQTARSAALIVARPGDPDYAFTSNGVLGVDPEAESVPSTFVSVLVAAGTERAPDRLAQVWASADRSADTVTIRQIDEGADTAGQSARNATLIFLAVVVLAAVGAVATVVAVVRSRRHKAQT